MAGAVGRYRDQSRAIVPGDLPREGKRRPGVSIVHAAVDDPNTALRGKRQRAAVNVLTDALENEYARKRISDAGYIAARTYQRVLERSRGSIGSGSAWSAGDRVDQVASHELAILRKIETAQSASEMLKDTAPIIGMVGQRILELVLIEGLTLAATAERIVGKVDRMGVIYASETFRRSCEGLADHWCSRHARAPR